MAVLTPEAKARQVKHLKPFTKGKSGNPGGGRKKPPDIKVATEYSRNEIERTLNNFLTLTKTDLKQRLEHPEASILQLAIGSVLMKTVKEGDHQRLGFIFDRIIGKVRDRIELSGDINSPMHLRIEAMTYEQRLAEVNRLHKLRELTEGETFEG